MDLSRPASKTDEPRRVGAAHLVAQAVHALKQRVAAELKTTFASHDAKEISLGRCSIFDMIARYSRRTTSEKYLINRGRGGATHPASVQHLAR